MTEGPVHAIAFDLDGTLVDSTDGIVASFEAAFQELALPFPGRAAVIETISHPLEHQIARLCDAETAPVVSSYRRHYARLAPALTRLFPDVRDTLDRIRNLGIPMAVVTSKSRPAAEALLQHLKVMEHFQFVLGPEDVSEPKPHPEALLLACTRFPVSPANMVYVGDSPVDIVAARLGGLRCVMVSTGAGGNEALTACGFTMAFENLSEALPSILGDGVK